MGPTLGSGGSRNSIGGGVNFPAEQAPTHAFTKISLGRGGNTHPLWMPGQGRGYMSLVPFLDPPIARGKSRIFVGVGANPLEGGANIQNFPHNCKK